MTQIKVDNPVVETKNLKIQQVTSNTEPNHNEIEIVIHKNVSKKVKKDISCFSLILFRASH